MYLSTVCVPEREGETYMKETTINCRVVFSKVLFKLVKKRSKMKCPETVGMN